MLDIEGENFSPEELASFLFDDLPVDPCSLSLLPYSHNIDKDQVSFLFEILITIYMEGILHGHRLYEMLSSKTQISENNYPVKPKIIIDDFQLNNLMLCDKWLQSLGYHLIIQEYESDNYKFDDNEYCKIILKDNPNDQQIFNQKKINKPYHFVMFRAYKATNKLQNIKAVLYKPKNDNNSKDKIFTVKFNPFNINSKCK